jgi:sirohydrochlorin ferrochelatase
MSDRHLLIVAHGSRRAASNDEVRELAERVRALRSPGIDHVESAFLELATPSIPQGLEHCVAMGAREIIVFPYFLAAGTHVVNDIPEAVAEFSRLHPDVLVRLSSHLGAVPSMPGTILDAAQAMDGEVDRLSPRHGAGGPEMTPPADLPA